MVIAIPLEKLAADHGELIRRRYGLESTYEEMYAVSAAEAHSLIASGRQAELVERVFEAYKRLEPRFEVIVCEGTGNSPASVNLLKTALDRQSKYRGVCDGLRNERVATTASPRIS